ncbi:MAG: hypothetical protein ACYTBJ_06745 [Planctomycetota bacterium]|jgi:hypothetical protein
MNTLNIFEVRDERPTVIGRVEKVEIDFRDGQPVITATQVGGGQKVHSPHPETLRLIEIVEVK